MLFVRKEQMREWLSGGAPPCQGGGRGFDPRLALGKSPVSFNSEWFRAFLFLLKNV